jgi:hypothetical protein
VIVAAARAHPPPEFALYNCSANARSIATPVEAGSQPERTVGRGVRRVGIGHVLSFLAGRVA